MNIVFWLITWLEYHIEEHNNLPRTLRDYMGELATGGYSHQWKCEVLLSTIKRYSRIWELEVTGKGHVNRPNHVTAAKRRANKLIGKSSWFKVNKEKGYGE